MKKWGLQIVALAVVIIAVIYVLFDPLSSFNDQSASNQPNGESQTEVEIITGTEPGFYAPLFTAMSLSGEEVSLEALRGKPVLLKFWASWCPKCNATAPNLRKFYETRTEDLSLIAVNLFAADEMSGIERYIEKHMVEYPIVLDETGEIATEYQIAKTSTYIFLNAAGVISDRFNYEILSPEQFEAGYQRSLEFTAE